MANALEAASLVMIPSGYENGTLGSLKPLDGTGDFTFSRGSDISATRINEQGYIEKGYENLLLQSNTFSDADWSSGEITLTKGQAGYDGTNDAWKAQFNGPFKNIGQTISSSGVNTFSVYAKAGDTEWVRLSTDGTSTRVFFNIPSDGDGNIGLKVGVVDSKIEYIANGWYRCSIVVNGAITAAKIIGAIADNDTNTNGEYCYIQDAMLNQGLVAYPYVETTTAPVAGGILEDMPRLDYSGSCPALLLEPSRTNLANKSEYILGTGFSNVGPPIYNANAAISLEGLNNAAQISALNTGHRFRLLVGVISGSHTASIFLKSDGTTSELLFQNSDTNSYVKISVASSGGVIISETNSVEDSDVVSYGNGWYRVWFTFTAGLGSTLLQLYPSYTTPSSTSYFYGLQLEEGSYPTSYIPTYGTSQTRLQELGRSGDYINTPITFAPTDDFAILYDGELFEKDIMIIGGGTLDSNRLWIRSSEIRFDGTGATRMSTAHASPQINTRFKLLVKRTGSTIKFFIDGASVTNTIHNPNTEFTINSLFWSLASPYIAYGKHNQLIIFPTALSDDECIELTTI